MYRIAMMVIRLFWKAPYYLFQIWRCGKNDEVSIEKAYACVKKVTIAANKAGRVKIESHGLENIPKENGFIFFPNHQGLYDVLAVLESCPVPFAFVIKKEASNVILLKQVSEALGSLAIDREDIRQSMKVIQEVTKQVKGGKNFLIFAEGTRSKEGNKLQDFKGGSFKAAIKARCPIVPIALIDSYKSFDTNSIKPLTVQVHFLKPINYEEYGNMKSVEIASEVKKRIGNVVAEYE